MQNTGGKRKVIKVHYRMCECVCERRVPKRSRRGYRKHPHPRKELSECANVELRRNHKTNGDLNRRTTFRGRKKVARLFREEEVLRMLQVRTYRPLNALNMKTKGT